MNLRKKKTAIVKVEIYSKPDCHLCDDAKAILQDVKREFPFELIDVDITRSPELSEKFGEQIPVIFVNGKKAFKFYVGHRNFIERLQREQ